MVHEHDAVKDIVDALKRQGKISVGEPETFQYYREERLQKHLDLISTRYCAYEIIRDAVNKTTIRKVRVHVYGITREFKTLLEAKNYLYFLLWS